MGLNITRKIELSNDEVKNIIIKYLHRYYNISGIFDIMFDSDKTIVKISENQLPDVRPWFDNPSDQYEELYYDEDQFPYDE